MIERSPNDQNTRVAALQTELAVVSDELESTQRVAGKRSQVSLRKPDKTGTTHTHNVPSITNDARIGGKARASTAD